MGRATKYLRKSINFGEPGNPARTIVEEYEKKNGPYKLSEFIRKLVWFNFHSDPAFKDWKVKHACAEKKELVRQLNEITAQMRQNNAKLEELGVTEDDFLLMIA